MTNGWSLPTNAVIGGRHYSIYGDYRDILEIFGYFSDPDLPPYLSWQIALALFYQEPVPEEHRQEAMEYLAWFINGGHHTQESSGVQLIDWEQDRSLIAADVNKAAGQEIRALPFLHWWTFLAWFHAIGEGQLSTVVAIRSKLARGQKLEDWEKAYYREHKKTVDIQKRYSCREQAERQRLEKLLITGEGR